MAVELRCPDCRAKLRLPAAPEAGTEVECPKCGTIFPAPEPKPEADEEAPKKKKKPDGEKGDEKADERPKKKGKKGKKAQGEPGVPKKRKAKKRETSKVALIGVIAAAVLLVGVTAAVLIWYFTRTPRAVEMMYYLPEDCQSVSGMNLGHAQKYPEFYKSLSGSFNNTELKAAGDTLAKALGAADFDELVDHIVFGGGRSGEAVVIRTKAEFDPADLKKLPGAQSQTLDGKTYYLVDAFKGGGKVRVFAPTNRLLVFCPTDVQDGTFKKMLNGHADSRDKTIGVRMGPLGKRITRGTFWTVVMFEGDNRPPAAPSDSGGGGDDAQAQFARTAAETLGGAQGMGAKASIGSREVRFEIAVWYKDGEKASNTARKWKDSELAKGDEGTPPKWWKEQVGNMGDKKIAAQMLSNLGFGSSGEVFYAHTAVETNDLKNAIGQFASRANPQGGRPGGGGGPMPGGPGGPPGGPGGMGPPGGPRPPGGMPRRSRSRL
jgi:hypothetical protein